MTDGPSFERARATDPVQEQGLFPKALLEGISLFLSTASALGVVYSTLTGGRGDSGILLGMATLLTAGCLALAFFTARTSRGPRDLRNLKAIGSACSIVLSAAWVTVYWDHLKYGPLTAKMAGPPTVVVSENVAWLTLKTPDYLSRSLVAYVDQLAGGLPIRATDTEGVDAEPGHPVVFINGSEDGEAVTIEARVLGTRPKHVATPAEPLDYRGLTPELNAPSRFMYQPSVRENGVVVLTVSRASLAQAVRLAYHLSWGVALATEHEFKEADRHFDAVLALRSVLRSDELTAELSAALKTTARYLLDRPNPRVVDAMEAIRSARALAPRDGEAVIAEAFLRHQLGDDQGALDELTDEVLVAHDPAVVENLRGLVERSRTNLWLAGTHYAAAARLEPPIEKRRAAVLQVGAAYLFASSSRSPDERARKIREESAALLGSLPNSSLPYLLEGFAHAIVENSLAEESFLRAAGFAMDPAQRALVKYWHALGLAEASSLARVSSERRKTLSEAIDLARDSRRLNPSSAATLSLLGELTGDIATVKDAHALASDDPRANRLLGFHLRDAAARERNRDRKVRLQKESLAYLLVARNAGAADADVYAIMGELSQDMAAPDDARRYNRESHRLRCDADSRHPSCLVVAIQDSLDKMRSAAGGDQALQQAKAQTKSLVLAFHADHERAKAAVLEVGVSWYQTGNREIAALLYDVLEEQLRRDVRPDDRMVASVMCNHAFIHLDGAVGQKQALLAVEKSFRSSLRMIESADCYAGLAATLVALDRVDEARNNYRIAREMDANYGNMDVLRRTYAWSDEALNLISRLSSEA